MRIGYIVDVHGAYKRVDEALAGIGEVDLLIIGGDITAGGTPDEVGRQIGLWREQVPRLCAVAGNMDSSEIDERLADLGVGLDGSAVRIEDVAVFGLSAAPISPLRTPYELDDEELQRRIECGFGQLAGARVVIFCPHAPPSRTDCDRLSSGEHVGSEVVRAFIEREHPHLVLCGHIHEARAMDRIGGSRIVNPGPVADGHYAIVDVDEEGVAVTLDG